MFEPGFSVALYLLANLVVFLDLIDLLLRVYLRHVQTLPSEDGRVAPTSVPLDIGEFTPYQMQLHLRPYAILVSVYNAGAHLDSFLEAMQPYRNRLWVIDDASTDDTWERLQRSGVKCVRGEINRRKPGAIRRLLLELPSEIATVMVLDPDVRVLDRSEPGEVSDIERVIFEFQRSGMSAVCPRATVRRDGLLARIQSFEYWIAFSLGRKGLADHSITSGAAIYRKDALARVLDQHSLSVYAEDLENTLILLANGERIYYDGRLVIETEGKRECRALFSQRVGWYFGLMRVYTENLRRVFRIANRRLVFFYQYVIYMGIFAILLVPLKPLGLMLLVASALNGLDNISGLSLIPDISATDPTYFVAAYLKYSGLCLVALWLGVGRSDRGHLLVVAFIYVFYAVAHIVPITVGFLNWFSLRLLGLRVYRDHYQDEQSLCIDLKKGEGVP